MDLIQKIKRIEQYILENFEELDLDDPIEKKDIGRSIKRFPELCRKR